MNTKRKPSYIGGFILDDNCYEHYLFPHEDDRVDCINMETKEVVLTYTANCYVKDSEGNHLGTWHTTKNRQWCFKADSGNEYHFDHDLLKAEVELSKRYLQGSLK